VEAEGREGATGVGVTGEADRTKDCQMLFTVSFLKFIINNFIVFI